MTVCIGAICQLGTGTYLVVGASDRMLTVGDTTEYEPPQHKVYRITDQAILTIAGDTSAQTTIGRQTQQEIQKAGVVEIAEMAKIYAKTFSAQRRKEAEAAILNPLGLDLESFLAKQSSFSPSFLSDVTYQLQRRRLDAAAIIAGVDQWGAHLYTIHDPGIEVCQDREGFAAIGIGADHALSQFMFRGYTPNWPLHETLLLVYAAKKRAEAAPGVGRATDMFFVIPNGRCDLLNPAFLAEIERVYKGAGKRQKKLVDHANEMMKAYVEKILQQGQQGKTGPDEAQTGPKPIEPA